MGQQQALYLTVDQLLERWGHRYTKGTLANKRSKGEGPPFVRFGRVVLYPVQQLEEWEAAHLHNTLKPANDNA